MNINFNNKRTPNFKGDFWIMTDGHSRLPAYSGTLGAIEQNLNNSNQKTTFIDAGDYFDRTFPLNSSKEVMKQFSLSTPNVNKIFNLGNLELSFLGLDINMGKEIFDDLVSVIKELKQTGIKFISVIAPAIKNLPDNLIDSYALIDDVVDGEPKKVLVFGSSTSSDRSMDIEKQKQLLKQAYQKAKKDGVEYDSSILISHNFIDGKNNTDALLDYAKNELNIKNLNLVIGGHPHSIHDESRGKTRMVYTPAQGKGAIKVHISKDGVDNSERMVIGNNPWDYTSLKNNSPNSGIILNDYVNSPLEIPEKYLDILNKNSELQNEIMKMPFTLDFRDSELELSTPCKLGTFASNAYRDFTNADFAVSLTFDYREQLPKKGSKVTKYDVVNTINANKKVYKINQVTPTQIKGIFEDSLFFQKIPSNSNFLEYSDNIKIVRKNTDEIEKVKQIYIRENNDWKPLFNDDGSTTDEFKNRTFSIATCEFLANAIHRPVIRNGLNTMLELSKREGIEPEPLIIDGQHLSNVDIFIKALEKVKNSRVNDFDCAEMLTV